MAEVNQFDILRLGAKMLFEGIHEITNVWHVRCLLPVADDISVVDADIQEYLDQLYGNITSTLANDCVVDSISIANVTTAQVFGSIAWGAWGGGSNVGEVTAPGDCLLAWGRTYTPRVQLRKYLGVFTVGDMANGLWNGTVRGQCQTMMAEHIVPFVSAGVSTFQGVAYNRLLDSYTEGTSATTSAEPSYQRRRRRGRGS